MARLYLIPSTLGDSPIEKVLPPYIESIINSTKYYIVENIRSARRFLKKVNNQINIDELHFFEINQHSDKSLYNSYLLPLSENHNIGIISEAGCPGVADPGSDIVLMAHNLNYIVEPLVGPSSILLSLMASGLNGQNFAFLGYLPVNPAERQKSIRHIEHDSVVKNQTQIFIETPYRNNQLVKDIMNVCNHETLFCIASEISLNDESIITKSIKEWKKSNLPDLNKKVAIFLIYSHQ